jgi:hypothetical protein
MYAEELFKDKTVSDHIRRGMMTLIIKFKWMKNALEAKTDGTVLRKIDTLIYDELNRFVAHLNPEQQAEIERLVIAYVKENFSNDGKMDNVQELQEEIHADNTQEQSK